jgi:hypothetical protein
MTVDLRWRCFLLSQKQRRRTQHLTGRNLIVAVTIAALLFNASSRFVCALLLYQVLNKPLLLEYDHDLKTLPIPKQK